LTTLFNIDIVQLFAVYYSAVLY